MNILVITDVPSPYKVTFLEMMSKYHSIDIYFQESNLKHRNNQWFKSIDKINAIYLNKTKTKRYISLIALDISKYDVFWNMNYTSIECIIMALKFRLAHKISLMHADGGIYKNRGLIVNSSISFVMNLNHYFTSSGELTDIYYKNFKVDPKKVFKYHFSSVLENDIDIPENKASNEPFKILSVGQQIYRKGYDILLNSIKDIDNIKLTVIGGKINQECEYLVHENNLMEKVEFVDFVSFDRLKEYYKQSDIFVLPTREDIWGLVLNEAMIYGLPMISTYNCGAAVEFNKLYDNCMLTKVDNVEQLKEAILDLINNPSKMEYMRLKCKEFAHEVTLEQMVKDYIKIFEQLGMVNL